jgi:hypothetical protein
MTWAVDDLPACRAVSLARYCAIIGVDECGFWGVFTEDQERAECRTIWIQRERDMIASYLQEAQEEIEPVLNYPLCRRWFVDENKPYTCPLQARWGYVIAGGVAALATVAANTVVDYTAEPAVVGPLATTITDVAEIHVYHPTASCTECVEVTPSRVTLSGGLLTIYIPRCRLVSPTVSNNDRAGLDYNDLANFLVTVEVLRLYNDPSTNAELVWPHGNCTTTCQSCGEYTRDGCIYVRDPKLGLLDVLPATYSGGVWGAASACCRGQAERVRLNYYAGKHPLTRQEEDAVVRLAHAKMPSAPCGCDQSNYVWTRDRNVPEILTRERLNCNFGTSDGAWAAWRFVQQMRLVRGGGI